MVEVGEHYRESGVPGPVFRVVGVPDDVTLLRVTDGDGGRTYSGEIRAVTRETLASEFEPADDPDAGFNPGRTLRNALQGMYWQVRRFVPV